MLNRRNFLKTSASALAGMYALHTKTALANLGALPKEKSLKRIGVQLYTVRSLMEKDFEGTLKKVAAIGYKEVEFAGYYERKPADIKKLLDELGQLLHDGRVRHRADSVQIQHLNDALMKTILQLMMLKPGFRTVHGFHRQHNVWRLPSNSLRALFCLLSDSGWFAPRFQAQGRETTA
ncbi:hypothetical protein HUU05_10940 [candidate division KSB1 bacterium]|nr:hypothetical protein [candidate division KSB1 bacterium]